MRAMRQDLIKLGTVQKRVVRAARVATEAEINAMITWWQMQPELRPDGLRNGVPLLAIDLLRHELALRATRSAGLPFHRENCHAMAESVRPRREGNGGPAVWEDVSCLVEDLPAWTVKRRVLNNGEIRWSMAAPKLDLLLTTCEYPVLVQAIEEARCRQWLYKKGWWLRPHGSWADPAAAVSAAHYDRRLETPICANFQLLRAAVEQAEAAPPAPPKVPDPPKIQLHQPQSSALQLTTEANLLVRLAPEGPPDELRDLIQQADVHSSVDEIGEIFARALATCCEDDLLMENRIRTTFEHQGRAWVCTYKKDYGEDQYLTSHEVLPVGGCAYAWRPRASDRQLAGRIVRHGDAYCVIGVTMLRVELRKPLEPDPRKRLQRIRQHTSLPAHLERQGYLVERQQAATGGWIYRARHPKNERVATKWHRYQWQAADELVGLVQARETAQAERTARKSSRAVEASTTASAAAAEQLSLF